MIYERFTAYSYRHDEFAVHNLTFDIRCLREIDLNVHSKLSRQHRSFKRRPRYKPHCAMAAHHQHLLQRCFYAVSVRYTKY